MRKGNCHKAKKKLQKDGKNTAAVCTQRAAIVNQW